MNLAEEFKRRNEEWQTAGFSDAPAARHRFAVFCHDNAEAIELALKGWAYAKVGEVTLHMPSDAEERAKLEVLMKQFSNAPLTVMDKNALPLEPSDRAVEEALNGYWRVAGRPRMQTLETKAMRTSLRCAYAIDAGRPEPDSMTFDNGAKVVFAGEDREKIESAFDVEAERPAFEAWVKEDHGGMIPLDRADRGLAYRNSSVRSAWIGWLARARLAPATPKELAFDIVSFKENMWLKFRAVVSRVREGGGADPRPMILICVPDDTETFQRAKAFCFVTMPPGSHWKIMRSETLA